MRRYAREVAFCLTYEYLFTQTKRDNLDMFDESKLTDEDKFFAMRLYQGAISNLESYKEKVSSYSKGFRLERVYKIDLAVLVTAMEDMLVMGTPVAVAINESVELAKKFSTDKSVSFVNGILGEFVRKEINDN